MRRFLIKKCFTLIKLTWFLIAHSVLRLLLFVSIDKTLSIYRGFAHVFFTSIFARMQFPSLF
jgi:hypothetical protein